MKIKKNLLIETNSFLSVLFHQKLKKSTFLTELFFFSNFLIRKYRERKKAHKVNKYYFYFMKSFCEMKKINSLWENDGKIFFKKVYEGGQTTPRVQGVNCNGINVTRVTFPPLIGSTRGIGHRSGAARGPGGWQTLSLQGRFQ